MIRNILWEVDDVLFDTRPAATYAISKALTELGVNLALNEIDVLARHSIEHCLAVLVRRFKLEPVQLRLRFEEVSLNIPPERQPPFPGVRELCSFIQARGMNVIVTDRSFALVRQLLTAHEMLEYFVGISCTPGEEAQGPGAEKYRSVLKRFGLKEMDTLRIGSQEGDMQACREAGLSTCLFRGAHSSISSDHHFDDYVQLLNWLKDQR